MQSHGVSSEADARAKMVSSPQKGSVHAGLSSCFARLHVIIPLFRRGKTTQPGSLTGTLTQT